MTFGFSMASAGTACDNTDCTVLVHSNEGPCPGCGQKGFRVRFGISLDEVTP